MNYELKVNDSCYKVESAITDDTYTAQVIKACEIFYNIEEEFNQKKAEYEEAKLMMEQLFGKGFEEYGLKSIKGQYINAIYIPEGQPIKRKKVNEKAVKELLDELGMADGDYFTETLTKPRSAYVRWGNK